MQTMYNNYEHIQALRDSGLGDADFQVNKAPVLFQEHVANKSEKYAYALASNYNGQESVGGVASYEGKYVYFREDTGQAIAIHGERYKPVQYSTMINKTRDMLERSDLDCTGIEESIRVSPNGGMCLTSYTLPATNFKTPDGDGGSAKVMALSSFNGVWSFIMSLGFEQWACLNSQIMINNPASIYKARHTNKLNVDAGIRMLGKTANILESEIELWHTMYNTQVTRYDVVKAFALAANYTGSLDELLLDIADYGKPVNIKNKTLTYLYDVYNNTYKSKMGENQWAVYNAITDWATHAPSTSKNVITLEQRRTTQATTAIQEWLKVA